MKRSVALFILVIDEEAQAVMVSAMFLREAKNAKRRNPSAYR
jgi:hypothetical protein